ncbi:hypothetical protein [Kineococcus terrestris]|uniref:hypothetical protein n=1 Tax=Kineococcus terrestris TaxID=2044856 RepID=UPI0034DB3874
MPADAEPYPWNALLGRLVGLRLFSVQFVLDHVQLRFDGPELDEPVLTCVVMPAVEAAGRRTAPGGAGYADALVSLVAGTVLETAEAAGRGLRIDLTSGRVVVDPRREDLVGPEIALLTGFRDGGWGCWRPGEDAFDHLA